MPVYKDKNTNKWYAKFYYTTWNGVRKQKLRRGFTLRKDAKEFERFSLETSDANPDMTFESQVHICV